MPKTETVYIATCALAYVRTAAGGYAQVFYGDPVPAGYDQDDVDRLETEGFLRQANLDEIGGLVAPLDLAGGQVPGGEPVEGTSAVVPPSDPADGDDGGVPDSVTERSTHAELDAYAAAQTPPVDLAGATTKAEKLAAINAG